MGVDGFVDKDAGKGGEVVWIFGRKITASPATAAMTLNFGMAVQVIGKAFGHNGTLLDDFDTIGCVLAYFINEQGIMGASQNDRISPSQITG